MHFLKSRSRGRRSPIACDDRGATAVEYGLMVGLIAVVIIVGVIAFGESVRGLFELAIAAHPFG